VHDTTATGPFIGGKDDTFILHFSMDITPKGGERMQMSEVGVYTVKDGKIAHQENLYQM
jgi:limonene-1,2-epoxide hydrolase